MIIRWLIFSVLFGLLPFIFQGAILFFVTENPDWNSIETKLFSKGELYFILPAIASEAIGSVIFPQSSPSTPGTTASGTTASGTTVRPNNLKLLTAGSCFIVLVITLLLQGFSLANPLTIKNQSGFIKTSYFFFGMTIFTAAFCKKWGEGK